MITQRYDVAVIGGGVAGRTAALGAAGRKKRVVLIDKFGCNGPSNYLGAMVDAFVLSAHSGASFNDAVAASHQARQDFLDSQPYKHTLQAAGVAVITATANQLEPNLIEAGTDKLWSKQIILATGANPEPIDLAGFNYRADLLKLFELGRAPKRLIVINPSQLAQKAAQACAAVGIKTTTIETASAVIKLSSVEKLQRSYRLNYLQDLAPRSLTAELIILDG